MLPQQPPSVCSSVCGSPALHTSDCSVKVVPKFLMPLLSSSDISFYTPERSLLCCHWPSGPLPPGHCAHNPIFHLASGSCLLSPSACVSGSLLSQGLLSMQSIHSHDVSQAFSGIPEWTCWNGQWVRERSIQQSAIFVGRTGDGPDSFL